MIFVTVGTTAFNSLVQAIDTSGLSEDFIIQKAGGKYKPQNFESFEFTNELQKYFNEAEIVITHGGAGSLFNLLALGKKVIAVANEERSDLHQSDILKKLASQNHIIWCKDPSQIAKSIKEIRSKRHTKYTPPKCEISAEIVKSFI